MSPMGDMFDGRPLEPISASEEFEKRRAYKKRKSLSEASLRNLSDAQKYYTHRLNRASALTIQAERSIYYQRAPYPFRVTKEQKDWIEKDLRSSGTSEKDLISLSIKWEQSIIAESAKFSDAMYPWILSKELGYWIRFLSERKFEKAECSPDGTRSLYSQFIRRDERGFKEIQKALKEEERKQRRNDQN